MKENSGTISRFLLREGREWRRALKRDYDLYLLLIPVIAFFVVFSYMPMYGLQIAFKDYSPSMTMEAAPFVGLKHLKRFINSFYFERVLRNTLTMSLYSLLVKIPAPILLALLFNEIRSKRVQVSLQVISYTPYFISTVVLASMIVMFLTPGTGFLDALVRCFGFDKATSILSEPGAFKHIYVWSEVWQSMGWDSIIYTAAIAGVPADLYEVARLEGAGKLKQAWYVTLPCISHDYHCSDHGGGRRAERGLRKSLSSAEYGESGGFGSHFHLRIQGRFGKSPVQFRFHGGSVQ